jgi:hypothetical protein
MKYEKKREKHKTIYRSTAANGRNEKNCTRNLIATKNHVAHSCKSSKGTILIKHYLWMRSSRVLCMRSPSGWNVWLSVPKSQQS